MCCKVANKTARPAQGLRNHKVAMQLFWVLVHLDLQQQHPGQGNPEAVFWQIHQAFLNANAPPHYNMTLWAQGYLSHHQAQPHPQSPPVVLHLSQQILQWAAPGGSNEGHHQNDIMPPVQHNNQHAAAADVGDTAAHNAPGDALDDANDDLLYLVNEDAVDGPAGYTADHAADHAAHESVTHAAAIAAAGAHDNTPGEAAGHAIFNGEDFASEEGDLEIPEWMDYPQAAEHASQNTYSDESPASVGQQLPVAVTHDPQGFLTQPSDAVEAAQAEAAMIMQQEQANVPGGSGQAQDSTAVQYGEQHVADFHRSMLQEQAEDAALALKLQASSQLPAASGGMQASTSSQLGMMTASHSAASSKKRGRSSDSRNTPSTQDSVYNLEVPQEHELDLASISGADLDLGTLHVPVEVQPASHNAMPVTGAHLRLALAAVRARVDAHPPLNSEQAQRLAEVSYCPFICMLPSSASYYLFNLMLAGAFTSDLLAGLLACWLEMCQLD